MTNGHEISLKQTNIFQRIYIQKSHNIEIVAREDRQVCMPGTILMMCCWSMLFDDRAEERESTVSAEEGDE